MNATQTPQPLSPEQKTALAQKARAAANAIQYSSDPTHVGALAIYFKAVTPEVVLGLLADNAEQRSLIEGYEEWGKDVKRLTREIDVAMHGDQAAQQASLCDLVGPAKEIKRLSELGQGDGGAYALQSLAAYFRESVNWDSYNAIRKAAHLANMCIDTGGADQMNGFASECPLCGDHFRDE